MLLLDRRGFEINLNSKIIMKKTLLQNEENTLYWEVFFQGMEQPCHQMFQCELTNQMSNLKKQKGEEI